jgi:hypothetical protein
MCIYIVLYRLNYKTNHYVKVKMNIMQFGADLSSLFFSVPTISNNNFVDAQTFESEATIAALDTGSSNYLFSSSSPLYPTHTIWGMVAASSQVQLLGLQMLPGWDGCSSFYKE